MIRPLKENDFDAAIRIVNENWRAVYTGYVSQSLLNDIGCRRREQQLKSDFINHRLTEYVWEDAGQVLALLSIGETVDADKAGAFEIWRIYIASEVQGQGIGGQLLAFAEQAARSAGYREIVIWAFSKNTRAIQFYRKYGYRIDKEEYLGAPYFTYGTRLLKYINQPL